MKTPIRNYFIFVTICILLFTYFYFNQHFYTISLHDTYYLISYFYFVLPIFIIGTIFYLVKVLIEKLKIRVEQSNERYSRYLLFFLQPNLYFKFKKRTRNYLVFVTICLISFSYLYLTEAFYLVIDNGNYHFVKYHYFVLPILIIGTIFYLVKNLQSRTNL
ncbi:hypothetical protein CLU81_2891 [Flavobacterium sp. 9]|nr:hypothetical protein CLU81_2891 [Flavobacterium sp. 9]